MKETEREKKECIGVFKLFHLTNTDDILPFLFRIFFTFTFYRCGNIQFTP